MAYLNSHENANLFWFFILNKIALQMQYTNATDSTIFLQNTFLRGLT